LRWLDPHGRSRKNILRLTVQATQSRYTGSAKRPLASVSEETDVAIESVNWHMTIRNF